MIKKYFIITLVMLLGIIFGVFMFGSGKTTFYVKNGAPRLPIVNIHQKLYQAEDRIGDISNNIIPEIKIPENLTKDFAGLLAKAIIDKNNQPKDGTSPAEPGLNMPDPNKIAEEFIKNGLIKANENILNIKFPEIKTSSDNSKESIELYLAEAQKILRDNLKGEPLLSILEEINKNNGQGLEKLLPVISAHEAAANQIEEKIAPSDLKNLMTEEVRMLRITANVLRALTNVETDPIATIVAAKQFGAVIDNWTELQKKFNVFIEKLNRL
ncbi:MAG: hypothetical protein Q7R61_00965 [bacterium]|nr:hypothetical protein [bacterium]